MTPAHPGRGPGVGDHGSSPEGASVSPTFSPSWHARPLRLRLSLRSGSGNGRPPTFGYAIAGEHLVSEIELPAARAYRVPVAAPDSGSDREQDPDADLHRAASAPVLLYRGPGHLGGRLRQVAAFGLGSGIRLEVAGGGRFRIADDGDIEALDTPSGAATSIQAWQAALLGPALSIALAMRGTWCLHGSAVFDGRGVYVLIGRSGAGKSTTAAGLAALPGGPFVRAADDCLPLRPGSEAGWPPISVADRFPVPVALPAFPQLALPPDQQPILDPPAEVRARIERGPVLAVAGIFEVEAAPAGSRAAIEVLPPATAASRLVQHTIAARLFDRDRLLHHTRAMAAVADRVPVGRLRVPHRPDVAAELSDLLLSAAGDR